MDTPDAWKAISFFLRLWSQLYPDVEEDQQLQTLHLDQPTSSFVVYYQMRLGVTIPQAKAYINMRHFCPSHAHIPRAIAAYYHELGYSDFARAYTVAM
jgi:hypothetical protein